MEPYNNKEIAENFGIKEEFTGSVRLRNKLRKIAGTRLSGSIIDAGCGNGLLLREIGYFNLYVGVDSSIEMLKVARQRSKNKENAFFIQAEVNNLPFKENAVDNIVCIDTLHHLKNDEKELSAIKELSRVGKRLLFEIKSFDKLTFFRGLYYSIFGREERKTTVDKIIYHPIQLKKVIKYLNNLGRKNIKVRRISWLVDWRLIIC